jgi:hemolysin activation/secretion protein
VKNPITLSVIEGKLNARKINNETADLDSLKLTSNEGKALNQGTLKAVALYLQNMRNLQQNIDISEVS